MPGLATYTFDPLTAVEDGYEGWDSLYWERLLLNGQPVLAYNAFTDDLHPTQDRPMTFDAAGLNYFYRATLWPGGAFIQNYKYTRAMRVDLPPEIQATPSSTTRPTNQAELLIALDGVAQDFEAYCQCSRSWTPLAPPPY